MPGSASPSSPNRLGPDRRAWTISRVHRSPTRAAAQSRAAAVGAATSRPAASGSGGAGGPPVGDRGIAPIFAPPADFLALALLGRGDLGVHGVAVDRPVDRPEHTH